MLAPAVLAAELQWVVLQLSSVLAAPLPVLPTERHRHGRRGRRRLLLPRGGAREVGVIVSTVSPPLASRPAAVPSSELASVLAWMLPRTLLASMLTSMQTMARPMMSTRRTWRGMA